jgi:DSF synthase
MQAVFSCRQHFQPVSYEELLNITNVWVNAAMRLEEKDLKLMSRLVSSQLRRIRGTEPSVPVAAIPAKALPELPVMPEGLQYAMA